MHFQDGQPQNLLRRTASSVPILSPSAGQQFFERSVVFATARWCFYCFFHHQNAFLIIFWIQFFYNFEPAGRPSHNTYGIAGFDGSLHCAIRNRHHTMVAQTPSAREPIQEKVFFIIFAFLIVKHVRMVCALPIRLQRYCFSQVHASICATTFGRGER